MFKKTKKGFTIVELIIVIAVIAILAAILIPTFIHLTNKANEASDKSLVTNLNKALAIREAQEGDKGKNMTMHDAVIDLEKEGYKLPQLATSSGQDLVWSQKSNRFFLGKDYSEEEHGYKYDCWHIYESMPETQEWGIYPNEDKWAQPSVSGLLVGFDSGRADISSVSYVGDAGHTVTIRTNGGTLSINAPADKVRHYGEAEKVEITSIAATSYHENGDVGYVNIKNGRLVIEEQSQIEGIYLVDTDGQFNNIKLAVVGGAELPTLARANVEDGMADNSSTLVVEIQNLSTSDGTDENPEYVWISKSGGEVSSSVSSSSSDPSAAVAEPSAAAESAKEETRESSVPVTDNSVARIGAKGYETFKAAASVAKKGEKIYLLKSFTLSEDIGESADGLYDGFLKNTLANEVVLNDDVTITFSSYKRITFTQGGRFTLNGHVLTLTASASGAGILNCQQVVDDDGNRIGITVEGDTVRVTEDLYFDIRPEYAPFMFDLMHYSTWECTSSFFTGYTVDIRSMKEAPILKGEHTLAVNATVDVSVPAVAGAQYSWSTDGGSADAFVGLVGDKTTNSITIKALQGSPMGGNLNRKVFCDVFEQDGSFQRYYWNITIPGSGPSIPGFGPSIG